MRRILKWIALSAATLLVVLMALLASLPLLLDSEFFKSAVVRQLSRATGGQWQIARLDFTWLPLPKVSVQGASFSIPASAQGKVEALTLSTALLPLLWGDVRLSHIGLVAPDVTVMLAPTPASTAPSGTFTVSDLRAALAEVSKLQAVDLRSLELSIERGRFVLTAPGQPSLTLSNLSGHAANHSGRFDVQLTTASDLAQRIDIKLDLDAERFEGNIQLDADGIDLGTLLAVAGAQGTGLRSLISLRARIAADSSPALKGTFDAKADNLSIDSTAGKLALQGLALAGEAVWTDAGLRITAKDLHALAPPLQTAAVLTFSPDWNQQRLEVKVQPADIETVKQVVLPWTTGTPQIERYARTITAGQLSGVEATLQLDQIGQWQRAIEVRGQLSGVTMALKEPELPIRDLSATLALVQGKLNAQSVKAGSGNSSAHDGRIELDFSTTPTAVSATTQWQADLAQVLALTKRQLAPRDRAKLDTLRELSGDARGSVALSGTFEQLQVHAQLDTIRAQASLEQLPWPITVTGAKASFDGNALAVQRLAGSVGASVISQCNGQITLAGTSRLQLSGCDADLALVELFDWASKRFALPAAVKGVRLLAGRAQVQVRTLSGALVDPGKWVGDVSVMPKAVRMTHPELPGEARLDGGSVRGNLGSLTVQGVKVDVLDTTLQVSGSISGLRKVTPLLDMQATGAVGEKLIAWGWERGGLEHVLAPLFPFDARSLRVKWPVKDGFEAAGELLFAGKTKLNFDALMHPGLVDIRKLQVQDEQSNMTVSIQRHRDVLDGNISGTLTGISLDRIVHAKQSPDTRVVGSLKYRLPLKRPRDFSANGTLRVNQLTSVGWSAAPLHMTFKTADVNANGRTLRLVTSFSTRHTNFDVSGTVRGTDLRYALDLDVKSDSVDVDRLIGGRHRDTEKQRKEHPMSWDFPVEGKVRLAIQSLHTAAYHIEPLIATLDIAPGRINFAVKEARLCGIGMAGGGRAQPETLSFDLVLRARDIDPTPTLLCLSRERTFITGRLDADAHLTASGPYGGLAERVQGPFQLAARDGRVDRLTGLAQVLDLVNASELLRGNKLGLQGSGFAYSRFTVRGKFDSGTVQLDEVVLDAQPFDLVARGKVDWLNDSIDMSVAVAPLQVLNAAVKLMPFLGYVLGGGFYAVPVGVRGQLSNPQIVPVAPSAVAGNLLGVLERTLKTPFNLREALIPQAMQGNAAAGELPPLEAPSGVGATKQ